MTRNTIQSVNHHEAHLTLGFCYSYELDNTVTVYCPDTTSQNWPDLALADEAICQGWHNTGQYCPVNITESPVNDLGYTEAIVEPQMVDGYPYVMNPLARVNTPSDSRLREMGYAPDEYWLGDGGMVYTLNGDTYVGHITEYCSEPCYLLEDEYRSHQHEMMF